MALPLLAPVITRSREYVSQRSSEVLLKVVPPLENGKATHKFFAIFVTSLAGVGFIFLLFINTLLAQDAFELSNLKSEAKAIADQREAIDRALSYQSAPSTLASHAQALGMKPADAPIFLNLSEVKNG